MTNKIQCYLLKLSKNINCPNIKRLPHSSYILKVECQMHLYPCVYLYFYATIFMTQYLISIYSYLLQNKRFFLISIFHIPFILNCAKCHFISDNIIKV